MLSISWNVHRSVCLSVCSLLRYRLNVFFPPLPKVGCPIFLEIQNPWGKVMEGSGLKFEHFFWKWSKIAKQKNSFFWPILPYKTRWKPRFPMVKGHIAKLGIFLDVFEFWMIFSVFKQFGFWGILGPPRNHASRWIKDLWSKGISLILAYF